MSAPPPPCASEGGEAPHPRSSPLRTLLPWTAWWTVLRLPAPPVPDGRPRGASCPVSSQPPRSALGPRRGRLSSPGGQRSQCPSHGGSLSLRLLPGPRHPHPLPPSGGSALSVLSSFLRAQGILSSSPPCLRGQRPVLSLYCPFPCGPGFSHPPSVLGTSLREPSGPRSLWAWGVLSPVPPRNTTAAGLCQPSRCVFFFSPRVRGHLCGQILLFPPSAPTTTETLPHPGHLVVATSCLLPLREMEVTAELYLPPPLKGGRLPSTRLWLRAPGPEGQGKWGDSAGELTGGWAPRLSDMPPSAFAGASSKDSSAKVGCGGSGPFVQREDKKDFLEGTELGRVKASRLSE